MNNGQDDQVAGEDKSVMNKFPGVLSLPTEELVERQKEKATQRAKNESRKSKSSRCT